MKRETLSVREAIEERRSIRKYVEEIINGDDLEEILRLTSLAPSAMNTQPWRFHVAVDPEVKKQLRVAAKDQAWVSTAPAVIVITVTMDDVVEQPEEIAHPLMPAEARESLIRKLPDRFGPMTQEQRVDWARPQAFIALGFLLLAARSMGYATVPMTGFDAGQVHEILDLPEDEEAVAMVPIGHADEPGRPHHRYPLDRLLTYH